MVNEAYSTGNSKLSTSYKEEKSREICSYLRLLSPRHQSCGLKAIFSLFCPPPEGAHKQLNDRKP